MGYAVGAIQFHQTRHIAVKTKGDNAERQRHQNIGQILRIRQCDGDAIDQFRHLNMAD